MDPDLMLIAGLVFGGLSVPSIMSSVSERRAPRVPLLMILISGALILSAAWLKPGGYEVSQIPDVFFDVLGRYLP